jgi:hypothetical protein
MSAIFPKDLYFGWIAQVAFIMRSPAAILAKELRVLNKLLYPTHIPMCRYPAEMVILMALIPASTPVNRF